MSPRKHIGKSGDVMGTVGLSDFNLTRSGMLIRKHGYEQFRPAVDVGDRSLYKVMVEPYSMGRVRVTELYALCEIRTMSGQTTYVDDLLVVYYAPRNQPSDH